MNEDDVLWLLQNFEWIVLAVGAGVVAWVFHLRRVTRKNQKS